MFSGTIIAAISEFHRQLWQQKHPHLREVLTMWAIFDFLLSCGILYVYMYTVHQHQTLLFFDQVPYRLIFLDFRSFWYQDFCTTCIDWVTPTVQPIFTTWCQSWPTASSPKCGQHTVLHYNTSYQSLLQHIIPKCITVHHAKVYYSTSCQSVLQQCRRFSCHSWPTVFALSCVAQFPRRTKPSVNFSQLLLHN